MNTLEKLHLNNIQDSKRGSYIKQYEESELASNSAEITEQIAIEFGNFLFSKGIEYYDDLSNGVNYTIENKQGTFTMKGLFQEFLKQKQ